MPYLFGFLCVCALAALPQSASAQAGEEHSLSFWHDEALKTALFSSSPLSTSEGYALGLEEMELRVRRARIGLLSTVGVTAAGVVLFGAGAARSRSSEDLDVLSRKNGALLISGMSLMISGAVGMIASGIVLGLSKAELRSLQEADYGRPRRVQWDLARSRVVF
ncbi:MAG: hypothetical protein JRG70_16790 [Deltaproteobacteria bacterium]|nr:hypothetical protein [Deltaproteobacteria bacterium]